MVDKFDNFSGNFDSLPPRVVNNMTPEDRAEAIATDQLMRDTSMDPFRYPAYSAYPIYDNWRQPSIITEVTIKCRPGQTAELTEVTMSDGKTFQISRDRPEFRFLKYGLTLEQLTKLADEYEERTYSDKAPIKLYDKPGETNMTQRKTKQVNHKPITKGWLVLPTTKEAGIAESEGQHRGYRDERSLGPNFIEEDVCRIPVKDSQYDSTKLFLDKQDAVDRAKGLAQNCHDHFFSVVEVSLSDTYSAKSPTPRKVSIK